VIDLPYAKQLFLLLKHGGRLDVRTDVEERAHDMMEVLLASGFVNPLGGTGFAPFEPEEVPSTRERRYLARAEPVWRVQLLRP
jgi:tRNA (guanine-N7-)-methyltransferase